MYRLIILIVLTLSSASLAAGPETPDLGWWSNLIPFRPSSEVQDSVRNRGSNWAVHRIEEADGELSVDYYSVKVTKLPTLDGKTMSPEELLRLVMRRLIEPEPPAGAKYGRIIGTRMVDFKPFASEDKARWQSGAPGAVLLLDFYVKGVQVDDGCIVLSEATKTQWTVSTIRCGSPLDTAGRSAAGHPVSGNRAFGFTMRKDGSVDFYTIGADRPTRLVDSVGAAMGGFKIADDLWRSLQEGIESFVNANGGSAERGTAKAQRVDWNKVRSSQYFKTSSQPEWR